MQVDTPAPSLQVAEQFHSRLLKTMSVVLSQGHALEVDTIGVSL